MEWNGMEWNHIECYGTIYVIGTIGDFTCYLDTEQYGCIEHRSVKSLFIAKKGNSTNLAVV
jgi:hypothetical protein